MWCFLLLALSLARLSRAQEGGLIQGATSSASAAGYSCDPAQCKLPNCACASTSPPGGIAPQDTPRCPIVSSYYVSTNYTNYSMVTEYYVAGNEVNDHTMTHVGTPSRDELVGNLMALNTLAGIPLNAIQGFRAPFLNYSIDTLQQLKTLGFVYDTSMTSSSPCNQTGTDCFWPYTLDAGVANDCLTLDGLCQGKTKIPGLWEVPMYAVFDGQGGIHLMDPWLDAGAMNGSGPAVVDWLKMTFMQHYSANRQPMGLYTHPIHVATGYPGLSDPTAMINAINAFLDWAQQQPNTWIVSSRQLLDWVRNPVPISQLNNSPALKCSTPNVPADNICSGIPAKEAGLLTKCPWTDWSSMSCYGCTDIPPLPGNPTPPQSQPAPGQQLRYRLPANCSTAFFDPIKNVCLCQDASCQFSDDTRQISANGTGSFTQGGTGTGSGAQASTSVYKAFSAAPRLSTSAALALVGVSAMLAA